MYYPQQSPGINPKLANPHDQSPWTRPHHPILVAPGSQSSVGPPPPSPGYALYANGSVNPLQHHPGHHPLSHPPLQHHHHNSLTHYPSPPNGTSHPQHPYAQGSPASVNGQIMSQHWQQQLLKCEVRQHLVLFVLRHFVLMAVPATYFHLDGSVFAFPSPSRPC